MTEIRAHRVTENYIEFDKPMILETTARTRRVFIPSASQDDLGMHLRGRFVHQKKGKQGWEDEDGVSLKDLKAGDVVKFDLSSEAMSKFLDGISILLKTTNLSSVEGRSEKFSVALQSKAIEIKDETLKPIIDRLIEKGLGRQFWTELANLEPDEAAKFADEQILRRRQASVRVFEDEIERSTWNEPEWGDFFGENQWIFGLGLHYQFLSQLHGQPHYGGGNVSGRGNQKGDFLHFTEGNARFVVLVEIKRPDSAIFQDTTKGKKYRNGVPGFDVEFANALSQVQVNSRTWETEGSSTIANKDYLEAKKIYTVRPRSLLIYGNLNQLETREKRDCFEIYRGQLKDTEIITYDELLCRAKFIIGEET